MANAGVNCKTAELSSSDNLKNVWFPASAGMTSLDVELCYKLLVDVGDVTLGLADEIDSVFAAAFCLQKGLVSLLKKLLYRRTVSGKA